QSLEIVQLRNQFKNLCAQRVADFERRCTRIFVELTNLIGTAVRVFFDFDFDKFRRAGFENPAVSENCGARWRCKRAPCRREAEDERKNQEKAVRGVHRTGWMRVPRSIVV